MPEPIKPKAPAPETIIELVDHLPIGYVLLAFVAGIALAVVIVTYVGNKANEATDNAEQ